MARYGFAAVAAVVLGIASVAAADAAVVVLANGDRVTGEVAGVKDGKLLVVTESMGEVGVALAGIARIESDQRWIVDLASGERVVGRIETAEDGTVRIVDADGVRTIVYSDLARLNVAPAEDGEALRAAIEALDAVESPWSASLELGANYSAGNSDRKGFHATFVATRESPDDVFRIRAAAVYAEEEGLRTANEQILEFREDLKFDPWYVFGLLYFERDEFEDLNLRALFSPGVGRILADEPDVKMRVEIGPALTFEDYRSDGSDYIFQLRLGFHGEWVVFEDARLIQDLQVFPGLNSGVQWRIQSETAFENPLSESLFFRLAIRNDYNTDVQDGVDRWDVKVLASIVYQF